MKYFIILTISFKILFSSSICFGSQLNPLSEVLDKRDLNDKTTWLYIMQRCSGLFATAWDHTVDQNPELAKNLLYSAQKFIFYSTQFVKGSENLSNEQLINEMRSASEKFQKMYTDMFTENWYKNGAYYEGTWIEDDVLYCGELNKELEDF